MKQRHFNNTPLRRHTGSLGPVVCTDKLKRGLDRLLRAILGANHGIYKLRSQVSRWNADN